MIAKKLLCAVALMLAAAVAGYAQEQPNTVAAIEFQTPKNGMVKQYEEGRKQKVEWHKQQKDTQGLYVFENAYWRRHGEPISSPASASTGRISTNRRCRMPPISSNIKS